MAHTSEWAFHHAVARDAAYATLLGEDKRELHAHAARWLESVGARDAAEVARHFELAGLGAEALRRWTEAARGAFVDQAFAAAREYATRALARAPSPDERRELLCVRADASFALADASTCLDDARAAESIAGASAPARLRVALCVAQGHLLAGRPEAGLAVLRSARAITQGAPRGEGAGRVPGWLWLTATLRQAQTMVQRGMADEALALLDESRDDLRNRGDDHDAVRSLDDAVRSSALLALDRLEDALHASRSALDRAGRDADIPRLLQAAITEGRTLNRLGQQHVAARRLALARDEARRLGLALYEAQALQHLGVALARGGATLDGLHAIGQAVALARRHQLPRAETSARLALSWVQCLVDDPGDVEPSLAWLAHARVESRADAPIACLLRAVHARLLLRHRGGAGRRRRRGRRRRCAPRASRAPRGRRDGRPRARRVAPARALARRGRGGAARGAGAARARLRRGDRPRAAAQRARERRRARGPRRARRGARRDGRPQRRRRAAQAVVTLRSRTSTCTAPSPFQGSGRSAPITSTRVPAGGTRPSCWSRTPSRTKPASERRPTLKPARRWASPTLRSSPRRAPVTSTMGSGLPSPVGSSARRSFASEG
ncbi:MAG: hypothetical protein R3A52_03535 [Polyangiales bacterium]